MNCNKLNTLKVLLPIFNDFHTNFSLEADDGCYRWSTSRQDIIQITPLDYNENLDCSIKAVVSCITKERVRNNALIIAENVYTGQYLRCDIIVDVIHSLTTITRTREILLEEDPVKILVRAYDNLGNEFSSLLGVVFNWRILSMGPSKELTVLNFVKFDDSPYESPPGILALESENARGNVILVEGLKTGSSKISVSLPHEEYKVVEADEVQFSVIANLILMPQEVFLMMGDIISFKIFYLSYGKMEEIVLPNKQYYLKTESSDIAVADQYSSEVTGMTLGKTRVILYDRNALDADPSTRMPSAIVNVVEAAYIRLSVLPHRNWAIFISHHHDIIAEVFTNTDHKINIGKGVELHTQVSEPFHVHERAPNGSWLSGWALKEGVAQALGTLEAVTHIKYGRFILNPPLTAQNDLTIYSPITLTPAEVILPWDPIHRPKYEVEIVASGGDGKYLWTSTNNTIGVVAQTGMVRTHSHGYFEVSAAMPRNHHNRASAKFWILPPIRLEIVEFIAEAEIGSTIFLHVALYAERPGREGEMSSQIPFTMCQDLPFQIILANNRFSQEQKLSVMPVGISCANVALVGHNIGSSKVTVSFSLDGNNYQDSVTVSAFKPLRLIRPTDEIVLAVGSEIHLVFTGGPRPSTLRPQDHHRDAHVDNGDILAATDVTDRHTIEGNDEFYTVVKVVCHKLGETKVTLSIGNRPLIPNCKTKDSYITVPIVCGKPRSISLQPKIKVADAGSCPMDLSTDRVVVQSNQDVELDVVIRDDCGRTFLNITSLLIDWKIDTPKAATVLHKNGVFPQLSYMGTVPYGSKHYQIITPKVETGIIVVTPTLSGYRSDILGKYRITPESPAYLDDQDDSDVSLPEITASISLYLVDDTVVTPDEVTLYMHPANKKYLSVKQGSGYYELGLSTSTVANVEYQKSSRQIVITPKEDGDLKITLIDLCLVSRPTVVNVNVVSVATIRVEMSDKVEINKCINCIVRLYDETDNLLNIPDMSMVNLHVAIQDKIATVNAANPNSMGGGELHYTIKGTSLGDTKLVFTVSGRDPEVSSSAMDLQIFPPLKLYPRNGTLIIGAVLQYSSKGGPQPDSHIEYSVKDKTTAEVGPNGILKGLKLGTTTIMARAVGVNPTTGQKIIYTEDDVEVQIIPLSGIRISAPLSRFQTTTTVPMWATGSPDSLSPLIIGTREPPIKFDWAVDDANIATIAGLFLPTGIQYEPEDMISIRVTASSPGRTKIHLNATVPGEVAGYSQQSVIFSASLELEVFEGLELISPKGICGTSVLMAPNSHLQLLTNKDYESSLKYSLMDDSAATSTDLRRFGGGSVVSISETGKLESHGNLGYSMILISATDEFGLKQTLSTVVEIKPIHYMLMRINSKWQVPPPGPVMVIPLGAEFELRASYHDNTGVAFTAGTTELKLRTSRFDLVKVKLGSDNSSVTVSTKKPGTTIIKIWADGIRKTADYVKLHVEQVIEPQVATVITGDIICFHSPLTSRLRSPGFGRWSSTEPHLLSVLDADLGILQASGVRGGHVAVSHSLHPTAPLQVLVQPISAIYILPAAEQKALVSNSRQAFSVPLVLKGGQEAGAMKTNNLIMGWDCRKKLSIQTFSTETIPFTCHMEFTHGDQKVSEFNQYFSLLSNFNSKSGQYSCDIQPNLNSVANMSTFSTNITLWAVADGKEVISNRVEVPFLPALQFSKQLDMDESSSSHQLVISGLDYILDQVMLKAVDSSVINVADSSRPEKNVLVFDIQLLDYHPKMDEMPEHMSVVLTSPLTEQTGKILINAKAIGNNFGRLSCPADNRSPFGALFSNYPQFIVIIVSMAIIFAATYYIYIQCMQPVLHVDLRGGPAANISGAQQLRMSPYLGRNCAANNANLNATAPRLATAQHNATMFNNSAPVYGDPNTFYNTSPELRRNRRYI